MSQESTVVQEFPVVDDLDISVSEALKVMKRVAAGDFEARLTHITAQGDLGELLYTVNDLIDRCDAYVRESAACMDHVSHNQYFRQIIETGMQGAFLTASKAVNSALGTMQKKVDDFSSVADQFETSVGNVVEIVSSASTELSSSSESMCQIAAEASKKSEIVATAAEQAAGNVQAVAAATEEMTGAVNEISHQMSNSTALAIEAEKFAESAGQQVVQLQEAASKIGSVVQLINDIASQTNLLALNATIEAARAGEAGKGFSVVAAEVKTLAQQTASATLEISNYVAGIQSATETTVSGINDISGKITEMKEASAAISAAVEEQSAATQEIASNIERASAGTQEVTSNITEVAKAAQETGNSAQEVNSAAEELSKQSASLRDVVSSFLVSVRDVV